MPAHDQFDELDIVDESNTRLAKLLKAEGESMIYVYDVGDDWRHEVVLERITGMNDAVKVPICLDGACRCPPEAVGGVPGYQDFLDVIFDPGDEDHEHVVGWTGGWTGGSFQAEEFGRIVNQGSIRKRAVPLAQHGSRGWLMEQAQATLQSYGPPHQRRSVA